jgi:hypothetical protein
MYYWQYKLAGRRVGPFACWLTGMLLFEYEFAGDSWARQTQKSIGSSTKYEACSRHVMLCCGSCGFFMAS